MCCAQHYSLCSSVLLLAVWQTLCRKEEKINHIKSYYNGTHSDRSLLAETLKSKSKKAPREQEQRGAEGIVSCFIGELC
jgi:hypothetical protein